MSASNAERERRADILVTGAGALASAFLHSLARLVADDLRVVIASRASDRLSWLARSTAACASSCGARLHTQPVSMDWDDPEALHRLFERTQPRLILHTASLQSPWQLGGQDTWACVVRQAGYGLTLPLHLLLAQRVGRAARRAVPDAIYINACYPDAVNPMLVAEGIPVLCGIGNVAILASMLAADMNIEPSEIRMIAHHCHVASAISGTTDALASVRVWRGGVPIHEQATQWFRDASLPSDQRLNWVTAAHASAVVMSLLGKQGTMQTQVPGPFGLPGGYPVLIRQDELTLQLPAGTTQEQAHALNTSAAAHDGVVIDARGVAVYSQRATALVRDIPERYRDVVTPFAPQSSENRARLLLELRAALDG